MTHSQHSPAPLSTLFVSATTSVAARLLQNPPLAEKHALLKAALTALHAGREVAGLRTLSQFPEEVQKRNAFVAYLRDAAHRDPTLERALITPDHIGATVKETLAMLRKAKLAGRVQVGHYECRGFDEDGGLDGVRTHVHPKFGVLMRSIRALQERAQGRYVSGKGFIPYRPEDIPARVEGRKADQLERALKTERISRNSRSAGASGDALDLRELDYRLIPPLVRQLEGALNLSSALREHRTQARRTLQRLGNAVRDAADSAARSELHRQIDLEVRTGTLLREALSTSQPIAWLKARFNTLSNEFERARKDAHYQGGEVGLTLLRLSANLERESFEALKVLERAELGHPLVYGSAQPAPTCLEDLLRDAHRQAAALTAPELEHCPFERELLSYALKDHQDGLIDPGEYAELEQKYGCPRDIRPRELSWTWDGALEGGRFVSSQTTPHEGATTDVRNTLEGAREELGRELALLESLLSLLSASLADVRGRAVLNARSRMRSILAPERLALKAASKRSLAKPVNRASLAQAREVLRIAARERAQLLEQARFEVMVACLGSLTAAQRGVLCDRLVTQAPDLRSLLPDDSAAGLAEFERTLRQMRAQTAQDHTHAGYALAQFWRDEAFTDS